MRKRKTKEKRPNQRGQEGKEKPFVWDRKIYKLEA
jgi:hypothetical protein